MSRPVVAVGSWEYLMPGRGWVREDLRAYRASLADRRVTVFGLFQHPDRTHCRVARFSTHAPMAQSYTVWVGIGRRIRIRLTEYPHA